MSPLLGQGHVSFSTFVWASLCYCVEYGLVFLEFICVLSGGILKFRSILVYSADVTLAGSCEYKDRDTDLF